ASTASQTLRNVARASPRPPSASPDATAAALTAPALVPLIQPRSRVSSRSSSSSTPQVKAPCAPPPCSARLIRRRLCFPTLRLPRLLPSFVSHRKMAARRLPEQEVEI